MRRLGVVLLAVLLAFGLASHAQAQEGTADGGTDTASRASVRDPGEILGKHRYAPAKVKRYARRMESTKYIRRTIPIYYQLAPKRNIAPDVLIAQAMVETGYGRYGGDSRPWNMAGIKKGGAVGDSRRDFEKPKTARAGVRMHVNHMAAYTGKRPIGKPHDRFSDARKAQKARGYWIRYIGQLGGGIWATDNTYDNKIRRVLNGMGRS
jgi:flagellum-specific peptidoglycan hydrolase FlgJ